MEFSKKLLLFFAILGMTFTVGCAGTYQVVKKNEVPLQSFSSIKISPINTSNFWDEHPDLKESEKWQLQVNRASEHIEKKVSNYFNGNWQGNGKKNLKISATLVAFNLGSRALRYWVGFGAGKGTIEYNVKLLDGQTNNTISEYKAFGTVAGGVFGGDIGNAYDQAAGAIIKYISDNR